jgi:hypothetical protein
MAQQVERGVYAELREKLRAGFSDSAHLLYGLVQVETLHTAPPFAFFQEDYNTGQNKSHYIILAD